MSSFKWPHKVCLQFMQFLKIKNGLGLLLNVLLVLCNEKNFVFFFVLYRLTLNLSIESNCEILSPQNFPFG